MTCTGEVLRRKKQGRKGGIRTQRTPGSISGVRGAGSPFAPAAFGQGMGEYIATANKNTFIAVQIETVEGLGNCEEIAKVDGIGQYIPRRV